ncbi:hypothetical protein MUP77_07770 [Candidatus Bathyarchaeota archaeon]|nr:hypothetical protein [Candidatus Bathyarchaeota archaeon]
MSRTEETVQVENYVSSLSATDMKPMNDFLGEIVKARVAQAYKQAMKRFLFWAQKTPKQLVEEFNQKDARSLILKYQVFLKGKGLGDNTIRGMLNAPRSFYSSQCETVQHLKGKIVKAHIATGQHTFSLLDLKEMWHCADIEGKALLSVGVSLGWEISSVLNLERKFISDLIERAESQKEEWVSFDWQREKEGTAQFGILTPCSIADLKRYLAKEPDKNGKLFNNMSQDKANDIIKRLTQEANVKTIGSVSFHLLRKFLETTLSRNGLNKFEVDTIMGHSTGVNAAYLQTVTQDALEKYKRIYPYALSLVAFTNGNAKTDAIKDAVIKLFQLVRDSGALQKSAPFNPEQRTKEELLIKEIAQDLGIAEKVEDEERNRPEKVPID